MGRTTYFDLAGRRRGPAPTAARHEPNRSSRRGRLRPIHRGVYGLGRLRLPQDIFLAIVERGGLPKPESNVRIRGLEVDFLFRAARLIVEIDGLTYHSSPAAMERDRHRDQVLYLAGYDVVRFTWKQLDQQPDRVLARVAGALARAKARRR